MRLVPGWIAVALALAAPAFADAPPPPLGSEVFSFPGSVASPGSAASAGVAQADSWLGDEPFDNPAVGTSRAVSISPLLYHVSRQDLRGLFRSYSEQSAFFDGAGGWVRAGFGSLGVFLYGYQPVLRLEENAYLTGPLSASPAPVENSASAREVRAGGGVSWGTARFRVGVAAEWVNRDDSYATVDKSGSPSAGNFDASFSASAVGGQAGVRIELGPEGVGHLSVGGGVRMVPELEFDGTQTATTVSGTTSGTVTVTRESGIEAGGSVRWVATEQLRVVGGVGGRTGQEWQGFGVTRGSGNRWGIGVDFHDARDPWTLRFGLGQDIESGVREPRNGVIGLGFGWNIEKTELDIAVARHGFQRGDSATSYDDRVILSVVQPF